MPLLNKGENVEVFFDILLLCGATLIERTIYNILFVCGIIGE